MKAQVVRTKIQYPFYCYSTIERNDVIKTES